MKKTKYILLSVTLSFFIFTASNFFFGLWYKETMFNVDEHITFRVSLNTNDIEKLNIIESVFKKNAKNNFSIVVHNNSKSNLNYTEYNFFTTDSNYRNKIITHKHVDFSNPFEVSTGDNILFDPTPKQPIIINSISFNDMSENAIVELFNFKTDDVQKIINQLESELNSHNVLNVVNFEQFVKSESYNNFRNVFFVNIHLYIFIICSLISILVIKDINNNFKEISLMKIEGESNVSIYKRFVLNRILLVLATITLCLLFLTVFNFNVLPSLVLVYYKYLVLHTVAAVILILTLTASAYFIISKTKIYSALKGFNQLKSSIIVLSLLKIITLVIITVLFTNYSKILPTNVEGIIKYNQSVEKYKNLYLINSSFNADINQVVEIERIKEELVNKHNAFSAICLPEGDSTKLLLDDSLQDEMFSSIYYIVDSDRNKIIIDHERNLDKYNEDTFIHYAFDSFEVERSDLKNDDYIYCTRNRRAPFNEKLYYKDYEVIKIEVKNIYDHGLNPNLIIFKAESKEDAIEIVNNIYLDYGEENQLVVESIEDDLLFSRNLSVEFIKESLINILLIATLLFVINDELVSNFITYDKEENIYLHLIGKSRFYMVRKYFLVSAIILIGYISIQLVLHYNFSIGITPYLYLLFIVIELVSIIYYVSRITFRKLRGL